MKFTVRVPATTANLGPGFDCLGLALDWWNTIKVESIAHGLQVECHCEDGSQLPGDRTNLVVRAMRLAARRAHRPLPPVRVRIECGIPVGRGLGSSAAAIVGGLMAGNALLGDPFDRDQLLEMATQLEGHPDNVAPALLGGLVIAVQDGKQLQTARRSVPRTLECVLFIPERVLSTKRARQILPTHVPRLDAVFNVGRAALWIAALSEQQWGWLDMATRDRLHQPYRSSLNRGMEEIFRAARDAGARGVALSGSGPSLIAFTDRKSKEIAVAMEKAAVRLRLAGVARVAKVSGRGAWVTHRR